MSVCWKYESQSQFMACKERTTDTRTQPGEGRKKKDRGLFVTDFTIINTSGWTVGRVLSWAPSRKMSIWNITITPRGAHTHAHTKKGGRRKIFTSTLAS